MQYAEILMAFGPRIPGSEASLDASEYIRTELTRYGWMVDFQDFAFEGTNLRNIAAKNSSLPPDVIIATHYDTRALSDQENDPSLQALPVPGANDGTSGTAVLLELARLMKTNDTNLWLVYFDGEDQGHINDWDWSIGADYFANNLQYKPQTVIVIDMIGDSDLNIYREKLSDPELTDSIWKIARSFGLQEKFIDEEKYSMLDDHLPFIKQGIPSCLLIDFDYPYWHTQADTLDKISSESLSAVGRTLLTWLEDYAP